MEHYNDIESILNLEIETSHTPNEATEDFLNRQSTYVDDLNSERELIKSNHYRGLV